jgi:hypothetical protein
MPWAPDWPTALACTLNCAMIEQSEGLLIATVTQSATAFRPPKSLNYDSNVPT